MDREDTASNALEQTIPALKLEIYFHF